MDLALALVNGAVLVLVAYIGLRQAQVKRELERANGRLERVIREVARR